MSIRGTFERVWCAPHAPEGALEVEARMAVILAQDGRSAASQEILHNLRGAGHTVVLAGTGWAVVEELRNGPDALLIDLRLPDWQHRHLLRAAIGTADARRIPVIVLADGIRRTADLLGEDERKVAHILLAPLARGCIEKVVDAVLSRHVRHRSDSVSGRRSGPH